MVSNIVILSLNRQVSRQVAEMLSEQLEMHMVDTIDLFEFDNIPRSLSDVLALNGERYFREKEKGQCKYVSEFRNTVIHAESGAVLKNDNIKTFKKNCLVVYLHYSLSNMKNVLKNKSYKTKELKKFFGISEKRIQRRIELLKKNSDIIVAGTGKSALKLTSETLRAINNHYFK
jgi:shikimate kinase